MGLQTMYPEYRTRMKTLPVAVFTMPGEIHRVRLLLRPQGRGEDNRGGAGCSRRRQEAEAARRLQVDAEEHEADGDRIRR